MKTSHLIPLWLGFATFAAGAFAQEAVAPATSQTDGTAQPPAAAAEPRRMAAKDGLRFNFRGAPLETVLNYMSEAAGFVIVLETPVRGNVDMWSAQPVTKDEAVQLLNIAMNKAGYTATAQGRTIVVSSKDDAKKRNLPIRTGNDPEEIPTNADMVTQIIPLRHIDAMTTARDLGTLLPGTSTITPNQDSNSLVVTDTNMNLRHVVELVNALDTSIDTVSTMKIFKLKNADPYEMAQLLTNLYATNTTTANRGQGQTAFPFSGRSGLQGAAAAFAAAAGRGGLGGGRPGSGGGNRFVPVVAVPDPRTFSVIVTASKEAMPDISEMVTQLDSGSERKQKVFVYTMENANVRQVESILKNLFQSANRATTTTNQPDPLTTRATSNAQNNTSSLNLNLGAGRRSN